MTKFAKYWRLTYMSRHTRVWTFLTVTEALEHVHLLGLVKFHLEDLRDSKVH